MKEWELYKCFRAFNTVHGKLSPVRFPLTLTLAQTLTQIQGVGFVGRKSSVRQFEVGQLSDHDSNFTGGNFPVTI